MKISSNRSRMRPTWVAGADPSTPVPQARWRAVVDLTLWIATYSLQRRARSQTRAGDRPAPRSGNTTRGRMKFGIFDHLDRNDLPLHDFHEQRLKMVEMKQ